MLFILSLLNISSISGKENIVFFFFNTFRGFSIQYMYEWHGYILEIPAEDYVNSVIERSVLFWDGKPGFSTHDHHILLACRTERSGLRNTGSSTLPHTVHQLSVHESIF